MKRRGFTLIELMVVIAIIIILAAIAIPNYLSMTARAKKSRVASDFAALATTLETYKNDWGTYPVVASGEVITITSGKGVLPVAGVAAELTGTSAAATLSATVHNVVSGGNPTAAGDTPPIQYMTPTILQSMINAYSSATGDQYVYVGKAPAVSGAPLNSHWLLFAPTVVGNTTSNLLWRTDEQTTLQDNGTTAGTTPTAVIPGD